LRWVGATIWTALLLDTLGESLELRGLDMEEPLEVQAHLTLHLIYLIESAEVLSDDTPRLVGVGVVADDLGGDHEGRNEETVTAGTSSGAKSLLQSCEEEESSENDYLAHFIAYAVWTGNSHR
jgi:hypothetical protein